MVVQIAERSGVSIQGRGIILETNDQTNLSVMREIAVKRMVEGDFPQMHEFMLAKLSSGNKLGNVDKIAWQLIRNREDREEVAKRMCRSFELWGSMVPVMDRGTTETWMAEVVEGGELKYKLLGQFAGTDGSNWHEQSDLWPLVFFENWCGTNGQLHVHFSGGLED